MTAQDTFIVGTESWAPLCVLVVAGLTLSHIGLITYRLWLHPLAAFPRPRLAAATQWYEAYYEFIHDGGAAFTPKIRRLHAEYGPIVRIGPNEISVNDAEFHDKLYCPQPAVRHRHPHFSSSLGTTRGSFSTVEHHAHRSRRMAYSSFFSSTNVMAAETLMKRRIGTLCDLVRSRKREDLALKTLFAALSFDTFYTWAFGTSLNLFEDLSLAAFCNETVESLVTGPAALVVRIFPPVITCARSVPHSVLRALSRRIAQVFDLHALIAKAADGSETSNEHTNGLYEGSELTSRTRSQPETLFSAIRKSKAPAEEKEASRMAQEGIEMFMASFTPGRTLFSAMHHLHSRPEVLDALRKELDSVNPDRTTIPSIRLLDSLPFLRAVMKEILRITFPVGSRLPLIADEDLTFQDWIIPPNTPISVNHRNLLFDPDIFPEPYEFKPERWLGGKEGIPIKEKRFFVPFGKGGRSCPGKEFAINLIQLSLAAVVQQFEFRVVVNAGTNRHDMAIKRESLLTATGLESDDIRFDLIGQRT